MSDPSDDLIRNYSHYIQIQQGDIASVVESAVGVELFYYLYLWVISVVAPTLSPTGLMFTFTVTVGTLSIIVISKVAEIEKIDDYGAFFGCSFLFFSFFTVTQLTRQSIASCFLLLALLNKRPAKSILFAVAAFLFHNSSAGGYLLAKVFLGWRTLKEKIVAITLIGGTFYLVLGSDYLLNHAALGWLGVSRLSFWSDTLDVSSLLLVPENILILVVGIIAATQFRRLKDSPTFNLGIGYSGLWFFLIPYNYLSLRVCFLLRVMLFGPYLYLALARVRLALISFVVAFGVYRSLRMTVYFRSDSGMDLWSSYHWYSGEFCYFVGSFF